MESIEDKLRRLYAAANTPEPACDCGGNNVYGCYDTCAALMWLNRTKDARVELREFLEANALGLLEMLAVAEAARKSALAKAEHYEQDWYAAKNEFGTAMAQMRNELAAVQRERDEASAVLARVKDKLYREITSHQRAVNGLLECGHGASDEYEQESYVVQELRALALALGGGK